MSSASAAARGAHVRNLSTGDVDVFDALRVGGGQDERGSARRLMEGRLKIPG